VVLARTLQIDFNVLDQSADAGYRPAPVGASASTGTFVLPEGNISKNGGHRQMHGVIPIDTGLILPSAFET
jgi:hypothetical protein